MLRRPTRPWHFGRLPGFGYSPVSNQSAKAKDGFMSANHALFFVWDAPREGSESKALETFETMKSFWKTRSFSTCT